MTYLGLVIANANYCDVFDTTDIYNLRFFVKETEEIAEFIANIYNVYFPWEKECLEEFILEKMRWQTIFYKQNKSSYVVVSDSFTPKNIEKKAVEFIKIQYEFAKEISPVIALKTITEKEVSIFLTMDGSQNATIKAMLDGAGFKCVLENTKLIENFFNVTKTELTTCIENGCDFNELVNLLSKKLNLPLNISFEKVRRNQTRLNACKFDTRR